MAETGRHLAGEGANQEIEITPEMIRWELKSFRHGKIAMGAKFKA